MTNKITNGSFESSPTGWTLTNVSARFAPALVAGSFDVGGRRMMAGSEAQVEAKIGSGRHSFQFAPPAGLAFTAGAVEVRRSLDDATLKFSTYALRQRPPSPIQNAALDWFSQTRRSSVP